jgi:glycosyltransferase involved in cell wall biosynthesis
MISVIILAKNEEQVIKRCIESVKWCSEIILIDDESQDKTVEIAQKFGVKIYTRALGKDFSAQRNFGISKATHEWILFVDADEVISDALAYEISNATEFRGQDLKIYNGFYLRRSDFMWGKQLRYGETGDVKLLRLGRRGFGQWKGMAHERWEMNGLIGKLINPMLHYPHQTLEKFLNEVNFYTDIRAKELSGKNTKVFFWSILLYPLGKFMLNYFVKRGFMDGIRGLVVAVVMSFHSFLVRGKLWTMRNKND